MDIISDIPHHQGYFSRKTGKESLFIDHKIVIADVGCTDKSAPLACVPRYRSCAFCNCLYKSLPLCMCQTHLNELSDKATTPVIPVRPYLEDVKYLSRICIRDIRALGFQHFDDLHAFPEEREEGNHPGPHCHQVCRDVTSKDECGNAIIRPVDRNETQSLAGTEIEVFPCAWQELSGLNSMMAGHWFIIEEDICVEFGSGICDIVGKGLEM